MRMKRAQSTQPTDPDLTHRRTTIRLGCVSYLNAKPLIEGVEELTCVDGSRPTVRFDVPAGLLRDLEAGEVDMALCPVIDYHRASVPLQVVPVGGIGCLGSTLTVRLYSRVPINDITTVYADTDSHTSVALLRVLLKKVYGLSPKLIDYHAREHVADGKLTELPETMLLIGDKVVTDSPSAVRYPHQLDLGQAWFELTGSPFVFATWMTRKGTDLGDLPTRLAELRERNLKQVDELVTTYAQPHGWPVDLAKEYLGSILKYRTGPEELAAIERFAELAYEVGAIEAVRPLDRWVPNTGPVA